MLSKFRNSACRDTYSFQRLTFRCSYCPFWSQSLPVHIKHCGFHVSALKGKLVCGTNGCQHLFNSEVSLRAHITRSHAMIRKASGLAFKTQKDSSFTCPVETCKQSFNSYYSLGEHLNDHVSVGCTLTCPMKNCTKTYSKVSSLKAHISKMHRTETGQGQTNNIGISQVASEQQPVSVEYESTVVNIDHSVLGSEGNPCTSSQNYELDPFQLHGHNVGLMLLQLQAEHSVPSTAVQFMVQQMKSLYGNLIEEQMKRVSDYFSKNSISSEHAENIITSLKASDQFLHDKEFLSSTYRRKQYYTEHLNYVKPVEVVINKVKNTFFHYIPIRDTIKAVLKSPKDLVNHNEKQDPHILHSYQDGTVYRTNVFLFNGDKIELCLFQDAFEIVNPIGAARTKHKLLAVYMVIGNTPLYLQSQVHNIHLVAVCKEKEFIADTVFGYIVKDLKKLEIDGVEICGQIIRGSVHHIKGDNLGSHMLARLMENFSFSEYFCRYCLISRTAWLKDCKEKKVGFYNDRTVESYQQSVLKLMTSNDDHILGVKGNSVFNELQHYHVCSPGLPPCIAHDLFEGVVAVDLCLYLRYLVKEEWFSYFQLNFRIKTFPYAQADKTSPPGLVTKKLQKLGGSASQIWCFLRLLPLLVQDKIKDPQDRVWQNILLLQTIVDIVCAPVIHVSYLPYLQELILDYLEARLELFLSENIKPKHHYISHYPQLIESFGPLIHMWTLRNESKHSELKKPMRSSKCYKNVTKSLSEQHQFRHALNYSLLSKGMIQMEKEREFSLSNYCEGVQIIIKAAHIDTIFECEKLKYKGTKYSKGCFVITSQTNDPYSMLFGQVQALLTDGVQELYLVLKEFTSLYDSTIRAHTLSDFIGFKCFNVKDLISYKVISEYKVNITKYLKLSHAIVSKPIV